MKTNLMARMTIAAALMVGGGLVKFQDRSILTAKFSPIGYAFAQEGDGGSGEGHKGGGHSGGSGGSGGGHSGGGGSGGSGGGHSGGGEGESGGGGSQGHGTRYGHEGHAGGQHGAGGDSPHERKDDRFGGGNGLHSNDLVPEGIGRHGSGYTDPDTAEQGHFRYWGGWTLPEAPVTPPSTPDTETASQGEFIAGPGGGPSVNVRSALDAPSRCEGVGGRMGAGQQYAGGNLLRLNAARGMVDPALAQSGAIASPYLMGGLQGELLKVSPNTELAGTYLGLIAKVPVTPDIVKKISGQVCGRLSDKQAQEIAEVAEQQRAALSTSLAGGDVR